MVDFHTREGLVVISLKVYYKIIKGARRTTFAGALSGSKMVRLEERQSMF